MVACMKMMASWLFECMNANTISRGERENGLIVLRLSVCGLSSLCCSFVSADDLSCLPCFLFVAGVKSYMTLFVYACER